jgi:uncharacterized protein YpiB (UPF0302 family)
LWARGLRRRAMARLQKEVLRGFQFIHAEIDWALDNEDEATLKNLRRRLDKLQKLAREGYGVADERVKEEK